jgi:hypothetical protein
MLHMAQVLTLTPTVFSYINVSTVPRAPFWPFPFSTSTSSVPFPKPDPLHSLHIERHHLPWSSSKGRQKGNKREREIRVRRRPSSQLLCIKIVGLPSLSPFPPNRLPFTRWDEIEGAFVTFVATERKTVGSCRRNCHRNLYPYCFQEKP